MALTSTYQGQICGKSEESVPAEFSSELFLMSNCRSRYEKFHAKKRHPRIRSREPSRIPIKELMLIFRKNRRLRTQVRRNISRSFPQSSKIHCYTNYFNCAQKNPFVTGLNWVKKHVRMNDGEYFNRRKQNLGESAKERVLSARNHKVKGPLKYLLRPLLGKNQSAVTQRIYVCIGPNLFNIC